MKVYEALAQAFVQEGTTAVFGMMGGANMHWMNAIAASGVQLYNVRHEGGALAMADGWARAARRPGVATTTSGPGVTQLGTPLVVASRARTPIVVFAGEVPVGDRRESQWLDVEGFTQAVECGFVRVARPGQAFEAVQQAFLMARSESRPVLMSAPEDVQLEPFESVELYVPSSTQIDDSPCAPTATEIAVAEELISRSSRVVVIAGEGARAAGLDDLILRFQELTSALVATTLRAKNWLRDKTTFHAGVAGGYATNAATELLRQADCVVAVGASLNAYTLDQGRLFPAATYIHVDRRPRASLAHGSPAGCYIQADARLALEALNGRLALRPNRNSRYQTPAVSAALAAQFEDPQAFEIEPGVVDPRQACRLIDEELPGEIGLVLSSGYQSTFAAFHFARPRRDLLINFGYFGAIGEALNLAIGALIGNDGRPTVVIDGDASFMAYLAEFETACRYRLPLLAVVFNDQALGAERHKSVVSGLDPALTAIPTPDLARVAIEFGGRGALVRDLDALRTALRKFVACPTPTVIDLRVARNVLTVPDRRARERMQSSDG